MSEAEATGDTGESMVRFNCEYCGQKIRVPETIAGKKGKCPKCKNIVIIPKPETAVSSTSETGPGNIMDCDIDSILDMPQKDRRQLSGTLSEEVQKLKKSLGMEEETEAVAARKLPWLIDIFLYPFSVSGIVHMVVFLLGSLLLKMVVLDFLDYFSGLLTLVFYLLLVGYFFYYFGHCVFDSSKGGLRAPDISMHNPPDRGELISQLFLVFGAMAVCLCPAAVYYVVTERADLLFWVLSTAGVFFLPMVLLRAVIFNSVNALNPISIIAAILRTFFPYCGLVLAFSLLGWLAGIIISELPKPSEDLAQALNYVSVVLNYLLGTTFLYQKIVFIYLSMVSAHLLGNFYWWHKKKLDWGI